ncbi:MAG: DNA primase [Peptostreptococcaceae bacterium]|nr:DNA primase [Peptostreptococcaceae bacterium]
MGYNNNVIDELKSRINIVDVIGRVVSLTKTGSNFKGVCPFHNEKTPSFIVSETKQIFTCFGCGAKGDAIEFVMKYYSLTFQEAIEKLAEEYNVRLTNYNFKKDENLDRYYEVNKIAARFFYDAFTKGENPGYTYMRKRGLTDETLKKFGIGYADSGWTTLRDYLKEAKVSDKEMLDLGLVSKKGERYFDKFRNRVMFPIFNTMGKVIGFGGRILDDGMPKYLNSSESSVFKKKNNLYGLNFTKGDIGDADNAIIVEGYMDLISLYQNGIKNVAASLGTALTENQCRLIERYSKNIVLSYDSDKAGVNAAYRGIDIVRGTGGRAKVLEISGEKDPDDYVRKKGKDAFDKLVKNAIPGAEFMLNNNKMKYDLTDKMKVLEYIRSTIPIFDKLSPVESDIYISKLSEELGISAQAIKMEISGKEIKRKPRAVQETFKIQESYISNVEKNLIRIMISNPYYLSKLVEEDFKFESTLGDRVIEVINNNYKSENVIDFEEFIKYFELEQESILRDIYNQILIGSEEDDFFNQCISSHKYGKYKKRESELIDLIAVAEDDGNEIKVDELTRELMEVSLEVRKFRRN